MFQFLAVTVPGLRIRVLLLVAEVPVFTQSPSFAVHVDPVVSLAVAVPRVPISLPVAVPEVPVSLPVTVPGVPVRLSPGQLPAQAVRSSLRKGRFVY